MGLAEAVALILALFVPTAVFMVGYYFFARSIDPFRRKERVNQSIARAVEVGTADSVEQEIIKLYRKGETFSAYELYKQAHHVSFGEAEAAVESLIRSHSSS